MLSRAIQTAIGLALGATVALGLARFAYALLLPPMQAELSWTYALAGGMNTANALGYLFGALLASIFMPALGTRQAFMGGLVLTSLALIGSGFSDNYLWLLVLRCLAGISGAVVFIAGGVLIAHAASSYPKQAATMLSTYYAGAGFGILLSGISLPFALELQFNWRVLWVALGFVALIFAIFSSLAAWHLPDFKTTTLSSHKWSAWQLKFSLLAYACFALGYIAYMTFSVAFMKSRGATTLEIALFWAMLGLSTMFVARVWSTPIVVWHGARGLAAALAVVAVGAVLPLFSSQFMVMLLSALCFGSFLSVVSATTALARRYLPSSAWSAGITLFTIVFAAGQSVGPLISGWLSDTAGGLQIGLAWSAVVLFLGALIALLQPAPTSDG